MLVPRLHREEARLRSVDLDNEAQHHADRLRPLDWLILAAGVAFVASATTWLVIAVGRSQPLGIGPSWQVLAAVLPGLAVFDLLWLRLPFLVVRPLVAVIVAVDVLVTLGSQGAPRVLNPSAGVITGAGIALSYAALGVVLAPRRPQDADEGGTSGRRHGALGGGDPWLLAACGLALGAYSPALALVMAFVYTPALAIVHLLLHVASRRTALGRGETVSLVIPLGPAICGATSLALLHGLGPLYGLLPA